MGEGPVLISEDKSGGLRAEGKLVYLFIYPYSPPGMDSGCVWEFAGPEFTCRVVAGRGVFTAPVGLKQQPTSSCRNVSLSIQMAGQNMSGVAHL